MNGNSLSMDQWIDWLQQIRDVHPAKPLEHLLRDKVGSQAGMANLSPDQLVDLLCIDLIQQRRGGRDAKVEHYASSFSLLEDREFLLDLIDAEYCVRREQQQTQSDHQEATEYASRFPDLASEIADLIQLNGQPLARSMVDSSPAVRPPVDHSTSVQESLASADLSFDNLSSDTEGCGANGLVVDHATLPVDPPNWFIGQQCVASGPGRWLFRGRDAGTGQTLAMKLIKLPVGITPESVEQLLQVCERASRVKHPAWTAPAVAAFQSGYLAVVRPWQFGMAWQVARQVAEMPRRLRWLAQVAYAVQSAHRNQAWHGALHAGNLIIDHQGKVAVVDAIASSGSIVRVREAPGSSAKTQATELPWAVDCRSLIKLVLQDEVDVPGDWSQGLRQKLEMIREEHGQRSLGVIGDELNRRADRQAALVDGSSGLTPDRSLPWRKRLTRWIGGS